MKFAGVLLLIAATGTTLTVNAAGVKEKKLWAGATAEVKSVQIEAEKKCGVKVQFKFDQASFNPNELEKHGMNGYCGDAFAAMGDLCDDADYKEAMQQVKELSCRFDAGIKKAVAQMKDGKVVFTFNWNTANHRQIVKKHLEDSL